MIPPKTPAVKQAWDDFSSPFKKGLNGVVYVMTHFGRFGQDFFSIVLALGSVLSVLALAGLTKGSLLSPWADFLRQWFGWSSSLMVIAAGILGILGLRRKKYQPGGFFWRVLVVECLLFSLTAFFGALSGYSLDAAEQGRFGGLIGWGLADLVRTSLGDFLGGVIWFVFTAIFILVAVYLFMPGKAEAAGSGEAAESKFKRVTIQQQPFDVEEVVSTTYSNGSLQNLNQVKPNPPVRTSPASTPFAPVQPQKTHVQQPQKPLQNLGSMSTQHPGIKPVQEHKNQKLVNRDGDLPPMSLLMEEQIIRMDETTINQSASILEKTLMDFGVPARVIGYRIGPTVTQFAVEPGYIEKPAPDGQVTKQKVRVNQISVLSRDLALALSSASIRIEAPVPGRSYVGIEIPNIRTITVRLKPLLESEKFTKLGAPLALALGRDVSGQPVTADLGKMPHLLVAGTTGSGKSVCIEAIAACLAMNNSPEDLRLVMIDPKMVELMRFNGLPHLIGKVESNLERIQVVLKWVITEMETRYKLFAEIHARDLDAYNKKMEKRGDGTMPRIVVIIDELADLMMTAPTQTEPAIVRLAQLARATGIHMIVATQRPSTDVVTGLIKANFPARISFAVASNTDSRVILDTPGAENLLGRGDMLFLNPEAGTPVRAQGVLVSDEEIEGIIQHWKKELPETLESDTPWEQIIEDEASGVDELVQQAIEVIKQTRKASASMLQRRLRIGYPRAASLIDELEDMGLIGPALGAGRDREVLIESDEDLEV